MTALRKTTVMELKLWLREPAAAFFTLALPLILLSLNGSQGNAPDAALGGAGGVDMLLPGYIAMVIATTGLMVLPATLASYREKGILRRQRATPLHAIVILAAHVIVNLLITAIGLTLLVAVGLAFYDLNLPSAPAGALVAVALSALSFFALSFLLAGVLPTTRTAQAVAAAIYFPMIFFSGAVVPREDLPDFAQRIGDFLPLTYAVEAIQDPWIGDGVNLAASGLLLGLLVLAIAISTRTFRWE